MMLRFYVSVFLIALGFSAGWTTANWRNDSKQLNDVIKQQEQTKNIQDKVKQLDEEHTKKAEALNDKNQTIVRDIDAGRIELRIPAATVSKCSTTVRVDDAARTANTDKRTDVVIESSTAAQIAALTARGDKAIEQLTALQSYVRTSCEVYNHVP